MANSFSIYRMTTLGKALNESLKELQAENEIREDLSKKVMDEFDKVILQEFEKLPQNQKYVLNAKCNNYNNCDDVWKFILVNCSIKGENFLLDSKSCKIVAIDMANNP